MAVISGYTSLLTEVASWLARGDLTDAIPGFVQNWEERFYRDPANYGQWMLSPLSVSFSSTATVPTDFLKLRIAYLDGQSNSPLDILSLEQILTDYPRTGSGQPSTIARAGADFIFGPAPSSTYTLSGYYYAKPALLRNFAADAAAHHLIVNAPDVLLYGALLEAQGYLMNDKRITTWQAAYVFALAEYQKNIKAQNFGGSSLHMRLK